MMLFVNYTHLGQDKLLADDCVEKELMLLVNYVWDRNDAVAKY